MSEGISFILRCRNEEATLERSLQSLKALIIPHEIIVILHRCTDQSADIVINAAEKNPNIRIFTYDTEISRAGYQTLATDYGSPHSIMTYYNWCRAKATKPWIFKWDADFIASPALINYLNANTWAARAAHRIIIHAKDERERNWEPYLSCGHAGFGKYIFWEVPLWPQDSTHETLDVSIFIEHASKLDNMKAYWKTPTPWYETEISEDAALVKSRMQRLTEEFGPEPQGMARASNPDCDSPFLRVQAANPSYVNFHQ
jgi:glycosyltransferase involved in cell wall biosynthesis